MNTNTKKRLLGAAAALTLLGGIVGAASAGEITGNGKTGQNGNSNSICSFSGLEDHPLDPGTTQNWGQIPRAVRTILAAEGESPGVACNGHLHGLK